jgi:1,4-alpha-glucan branching enzyme
MVSRPLYVVGLGFGMKWNMGGMHDPLEYVSEDPLFRKYHHHQMTFCIWYAFHENFILPLSCHPSGCYFLKVNGAKEARSDLWNFSPRLRARFGRYSA